MAILSVTMAALAVTIFVLVCVHLSRKYKKLGVGGDKQSLDLRHLAELEGNVTVGAGTHAQRSSAEHSARVPEGGRLMPTIHVNPGLMPDAEPPDMDANCDHDPIDFVLLANGETLYFKGAPRPWPTLTVEINQLLRPTRTVIFNQEFIRVGSAPHNDLRIEDTFVSRMHALIQVAADGPAHITDLGSRNGTVVNNGRIIKCRLNSGDIVDIGRMRLVIRITPAKTVPQET